MNTTTKTVATVKRNSVDSEGNATVVLQWTEGRVTYQSHVSLYRNELPVYTGRKVAREAAPGIMVMCDETVNVPNPFRVGMEIPYTSEPEVPAITLHLPDGHTYDAGMTHYLSGVPTWWPQDPM